MPKDPQGIFDVIGYNIRNDVRQRGEFQLRDAMEALMESQGLYAYEVEEQRYDIGIPEEFIRAVVGFGLNGPYRERIKAELLSSIADQRKK